MPLVQRCDIEREEYTLRKYDEYYATLSYVRGAAKGTEEREEMVHHQRATPVRRTNEVMSTYTANAAQLSGASGIMQNISVAPILESRFAPPRAFHHLRKH